MYGKRIWEWQFDGPKSEITKRVACDFKARLARFQQLKMSKNAIYLYILLDFAELVRLVYSLSILRDAWGNACKDSNIFGVGAQAFWDLQVTIRAADARDSPKTVGDMAGYYGNNGGYSGGGHHGNNNDYNGGDDGGYNGGYHGRKNSQDNYRHNGGNNKKQKWNNGNGGNAGNNCNTGNHGNNGSQSLPQDKTGGTKADQIRGTLSGLVREKI